jgi:molecular chaperone DnaK (HSP70)
MHPFGYVGIDFGTSNSHFAYCNAEGDLRPQTIQLAGKPSVTTCVLWRWPAQEEGDILAYGAEAVEAWTGFEAQERAGCHFAFGFKPDLVHSERARRDAWAFLLKARQEVERAGLPRPLGPGSMAVVVGVPAEIGAEHRRLTAEAARAAGFGDVEFVEEPLGALAFHLSAGDVTPAEARAGVVVVDFGGGTLDVALQRDGGNTQGGHEPPPG